MKQKMESFINSSPIQANSERERIKLAATIREKDQRGLTLTEREKEFKREQQKDNWENDNPRYGH